MLGIDRSSTGTAAAAMSDSDSSSGSGGSGSERVKGWKEGDVLAFNWGGKEWSGWCVEKVEGEGKAVLREDGSRTSSGGWELLWADISDVRRIRYQL